MVSHALSTSVSGWIDVIRARWWQPLPHRWRELCVGIVVLHIGCDFVTTATTLAVGDAYELVSVRERNPLLPTEIGTLAGVMGIFGVLLVGLLFELSARFARCSAQSRRRYQYLLYLYFAAGVVVVVNNLVQLWIALSGVS